MTEPTKAAGPLVGLRVLEFSSIGPGPHCAMLLADLGAEVSPLSSANTSVPTAIRSRILKSTLGTERGDDIGS
ncbi:MAG TPA: CoA transferase [Steroidobacteraceae bacterium]|nr:CoA transferase [Steroidobacteraceae bacterium]